MLCSYHLMFLSLVVAFISTRVKEGGDFADRVVAYGAV